MAEMGYLALGVDAVIEKGVDDPGKSALLLVLAQAQAGSCMKYGVQSLAFLVDRPLRKMLDQEVASGPRKEPQ